MRRIVRDMLALGLTWIACLTPARAYDAPPTSPGQPRNHEVPALKVERYSLPNGLTVLLHEDHKTPVVAVNVWFKVGSRDEIPGRTGFAHLFEHMMFQGSKHHDRDYIEPLEKLGAVINGTTNEDRTMYYETVPSNALERALWLEADRMGFLLPAMTQAKLDNQRDVVKNERRESVDNVPYGQAEEAILAALYPAGHPYHHSVIGSMADLSAASLADVAAFFRNHYIPNNAILCLAGDFQPEQATRWIEKYFGPIPRGPDVAEPKPNVPALNKAKHLTMTDRVSLPRAQLIWPTVPATHPDEPALDVLAAVLGGLEKENRLFRALMYDRQLAAGVSASHPTHLLTGTFEVVLEARPGQKLAELTSIALSEIERLKRDGPTADEVHKVQNERESSLIMGLQSVTRKASVLNQYQAMTGDPLGYRIELAKVFAVTPEDVKHVARKYLGTNSIELDVVPGPPATRAPETAVDRSKQAPLENPPLVQIHDTFDRSVMPKLGATPRFTPPAFTRRRLSSGVQLLVAERHELPIVSFDLVVKSGETHTPKGKEGLASIAASLLDEGTKTRDALQIAGALAEIGASLEAGGGLESTTVGLTALTRHLDKALELYTDILLNPTFPDKELNRLKLQRLAELKARDDDAEAIAAELFPRLVYGTAHPYGRPADGTPDSIKSLTRADAIAFFQRIFVPGNAALIVVGDVKSDRITAILEHQLRAWKPGPIPPSVVPDPPSERNPSAVYLVDKPAAAQSVLAVGRVGAARKSPDLFPLIVMNAILGGQFSSRINLNLREDKGYSYGARSSFSFDKGPGPFEASGTVQTAVTKEALAELMKELTDISGPRTATDAEIGFAKQRIIQGFPNRFETTFGVAGQLASLVAYELPDDYYATYQARMEAVSKADVDRVARSYITPQTMTILVVGDRSQVEAPLRSLPFARTIRYVDTEGRPLPAPAGDRKPATRAGTTRLERFNKSPVSTVPHP